jgi:multidomain signaling protein FimX
VAATAAPTNQKPMDSTPLALTHLLVVAEDNLAANRLISHLRQERIAVRAANVVSTHEFSHLVAQDQWDVLVCYDTGKLSLDTVLSLRKQHEQDFPVIFVTGQSAQADLLALYRRGVHEVVADDPVSLLLLSVQRAASHYFLKRQVRRQDVLHRELEKRHEALLNASTTPVAYIQDGIHLYCNAEYAKFLGYNSPAAVQVKPFLNLLVLAERDRLKTVLRQTAPTEITVTAQVLRADNSEIPTQLLLIPVDYQGRACLQVTLALAAGNPEYSTEVAQLNALDLVSKAANRAHFCLQIEAAIRKAVQLGSFSTLLLIKLHELAELSAVIGKATTNLLLKDLTHLLQQVTGNAEDVGRVEADCFAVLIANSNPTELEHLTSRIQVQLNNLIRGLVPPSLALETNVGMSLINGHALDAETILQRAQPQLTAGSSSPSAANASPLPDATGALSYLTTAINEDRFVLNYQPLVPITTGSRQGYVILLRMLDNQGNEIRPDEFMPLAITHGMGEVVDRLVVSRLLKATEITSNNDLLLLHLTSTTLISRTFLPWLHSQLTAANFPIQRLVLYLSEIDIHNNYDLAKTFVSNAKELGLAIAASHFGSAIDPFSIFKYVLPNVVSLDESVVRDLIYSPTQKHHVKTLIDALHERSIKVAASQVEQLDALPVLWSIGADFVQGYCLQAPAKEMNYPFVQEEEITISAPIPR